MGVENGLPFVAEVAFCSKEQFDHRREVIFGLNFSPVLEARLDDLLEDCWLTDSDSVMLAIHQTCPRLAFTTLGKGVVAESPAMQSALEHLIPYVLRDFKRQKRRVIVRTQHNERAELRQEHLDELAEKDDAKVEIKAATYAVMEEAYLKASGDGKFPANARQIMYAARPLVLERTGGKIWKEYSCTSHRHCSLSIRQSSRPDEKLGRGL